MQGNVLWPGLFVVQTRIGCGSGGRWSGRGGFEKKEVGSVGLSFNRVPPRIIRVVLQCQPQLVSQTISAIFSARVPTPSTRTAGPVRVVRSAVSNGSNGGSVY